MSISTIDPQIELIGANAPSQHPLLRLNLWGYVLMVL
jgi:hypothetical protein